VTNGGTIVELQRGPGFSRIDEEEPLRDFDNLVTERQSMGVFAWIGRALSRSAVMWVPTHAYPHLAAWCSKRGEETPVP
jgi:hypothetical protein